METATRNNCARSIRDRVASRSLGAGQLGACRLYRLQIGKFPPVFGGSWRTGGDAPGNWQVIEDPTAPSLFVSELGSLFIAKRAGFFGSSAAIRVAGRLLDQRTRDD